MRCAIKTQTAARERGDQAALAEAKATSARSRSISRVRGGCANELSSLRNTRRSAFEEAMADQRVAAEKAAMLPRTQTAFVERQRAANGNASQRTKVTC
jgi:hypothetical protein